MNAPDGASLADAGTGLPASTLDAPALATHYAAVRRQTQALAAPLSPEDAQAQSMPDASPTKWHLAHTTWFFETVVLAHHEGGFRWHRPEWRALFNSYYQALGERHPRPQRGLLTRPTLAEVMAWRAAVDERVLTLLAQAGAEPRGAAMAPVLALVQLGLHHEQQHQELLLADALHLLSCNPLRPAYAPLSAGAAAALSEGASAGASGARDEPPAAGSTWQSFAGGRVEIGHTGPGFAFDNETPRHPRWLAPFELGTRLVTQGQWLEFMADGGYADPRWWLSAGWDWVQAQRVCAPLHWLLDGESADAPAHGAAHAAHQAQRWQVFGLHGPQPMQADVPVLHLSFFEAEAYARWAAAQHAHGAPSRLPTEAEWEHAAAACGTRPDAGHLLEGGALGARPAAPGPGMRQLFGDAWEWTRSAYEPYPGYRPWAGAVGEYNGKFMLDQQVLRGGSFATPRSHLRASYRNFFPAPARWQFTGLRLARDAG